MSSEKVTHLLTRLNAKISNVQKIPGGGNVGVLSFEDICIGLAKIRNRAASELILAKWLGYDSQIVESELRDLLSLIAHKEKWNFQKEETIGRLAALAIDEEIVPRKCSKCVGRGSYIKQTLRVDCDKCDGKGVLKRNLSEKARYLGVTRSVFTKTWDKRHRRAGMILAEWESLALRVLSDALFRD